MPSTTYPYTADMGWPINRLLDMLSSSMPSPSLSSPVKVTILLEFVEKLSEVVHLKSEVCIFFEVRINSKPLFLIYPRLEAIFENPVISGKATSYNKSFVVVE